MDPLAEEFFSSSPYNYVDGNPITRIDPDGRAWFTKYIDEDGNELLNTEDGSDDIITISDARKDEFLKLVSVTPKEMQDMIGGNMYWKTEMLGFDTADEMERYLGNTSSHWSRQQLINCRQKPTQTNWAKFVFAEAASQNMNPLNHIPDPVNINFKTPKQKLKFQAQEHQVLRPPMLIHGSNLTEKWEVVGSQRKSAGLPKPLLK